MRISRTKKIKARTEKQIQGFSRRTASYKVNMVEQYS